mmetsp:Transcript_57140/g.165749  ORF Transcript_57140/g.165749 Transcript_57140/m.165749 type:complete len:205 (+) Transcript_57140:743-1357(+)
MGWLRSCPSELSAGRMVPFSPKAWRCSFVGWLFFGADVASGSWHASTARTQCGCCCHLGATARSSRQSAGVGGEATALWASWCTVPRASAQRRRQPRRHPWPHRAPVALSIIPCPSMTWLATLWSSGCRRPPPSGGASRACAASPTSIAMQPACSAGRGCMERHRALFGTSSGLTSGHGCPGAAGFATPCCASLRTAGAIHCPH